MKYLLLLLVSISGFSQTVSDRNKIIARYDQEKIALLKNKTEAYYRSQQLLIEQYKKNHPYVESETNLLQKFDNGFPLFYTVNNQGSAITLAADKLYPGGSLGLSLTGAGMVCGIWDGGRIKDSHQELTGGKIIFGDENPTNSDHATHVAGTILATGVSPTRKGIAYDGIAVTYSFAGDYPEMITFAENGNIVSNHSYGYIVTNFPNWRFGSYDISSIEIDDASNAFPYYQMVIAAGNDRNDNTIPQLGVKGGYDMLTGASVSKNSIVVAAVNGVPNYLDESSVIMSSFSNFGPTDDGRIKPDIAAKGVAVSSCTGPSNSSYSSYQGTSMATPAITGMIMLLQQHYNDLNGEFMKAATVRGLVCHSAKEAGLNLGPDYEYGWGLGNAELGAEIISGKDVTTLLEQNTLLNAQVFTKQISITSTQDITATICWTDPTGNSNASGDNDNRTPRLKNNLDLKIFKDGITYYPWKLDPSDPAAGATNDSDNDVDNIEKVQLFGAEPGVYTIQVTHKGTLLGGQQDFSLIANGVDGLSLNTRDYNLEDNIFVYPNPTNDILNYNIKNNIEITSINIHDISGKELFRNDSVVDSSAINVSNLSSGVYFITFQSDRNSVTKKFIKK
ncbi:S8 family serine peptidase [Flavobacterium sp. 102]|uniref:S8 family serine peptidase n=1 Tax=Flavobacterium sp. 102 TaxID=2135623 RepID=UPI000EAC2B9A|nr:S8 family serine peptidase [Flavobacterium sp. 102]RKS00523.1 putative secreted protein (Por secretion system target) [Flavobacterium sp. 102]